MTCLVPFMCRYADDVVFAFQYQEEAEKFFHRALPGRLGRYRLELAKSKSRLVRFSRFQVGKFSKSFDFLGFEFRWVKDRQGDPRVTRRTSRKRLRRSLARLKEWIKEQRSTPLRIVMKTLKCKLRGYYNYYGVKGNSRSLRVCYLQVLAIVLKWLNRRSQRRSYGWRQFKTILKRFQIPEPRITECNYQMELNHAC